MLVCKCCNLPAGCYLLTLAWLALVPSGEHGGEGGIFQHLFYLLHDGCTLKTVCWVGHLPAHWFHCLGCGDWCSPAHRQKGILKRS